MTKPDPGPIIRPHLDRWVDIGLLTTWTENLDGHWRRWLLTWASGRVTVWAEREVRAAVIAIHEVEGRLADA